MLRVVLCDSDLTQMYSKETPSVLLLLFNDFVFVFVNGNGNDERNKGWDLKNDLK